MATIQELEKRIETIEGFLQLSSEQVKDLHNTLQILNEGLIKMAQVNRKSYESSLGAFKILDCLLRDYAKEITKTGNLSPNDIIDRVSKCSQELTEPSVLFVVQ